MTPGYCCSATPVSSSWVSGLDLHSEDSKFDEDTCQQKENHGGFNEGR